MAGGCAIAAVLGLSAWRSGMFFDADFYGLEIVLMVCAALAAIAGRLRPGQIRTPAWSFAPAGMAALFALELALGPATVKGTTDLLIRWTTYASWMVLLAFFLIPNEDNRKAGWRAWHAVGLFVVGGGLAGWLGFVGDPRLVFRSGDLALAATGARLAGYLEYPNAFGAAAAAWVLAQWQLLLHGRRAEIVFAALTLVPYTTALLLTESRGALLALAFGFALALMLQRRERLGMGLAAAGAAIGLSAWVARAAFAAMLDGHPGTAVWPLAAATLAGALALLALRGRFPAVRAGRAGRIAAALTTVPGGAAALAAGLASAYAALVGGGSADARVGGQFETAVSRIAFYTDALRMFADHPLLGAGGKSWRMLVGLYRQKPYIGNEVHSGYLDILLDVGLIGLLLLLGMLLWCALRLRKRADQAWGPAAVLLAHSAIDFDWSYGFMWLMLIAWLALHLAAAEADRASASVGAFAAADANAEGAPRRAVRRRGALHRIAGLLPAAMLLGCAAAALPAAWHSLAAARAYADAPAAAGPAREAKLRAALQANPAYTRIRLELAPLLPPQERVELLAAGLRYEPHSPPLALALGMAYAELGDAARARDYLREGLRLNRFDRDAQNAAIARMARLAERLSDAGAESAAREAAEAAAEFFERYRELYRRVYAGGNNPWDARRDNLFSGAKVNAAKAMLRIGRTQEAQDVLREVAEEENGDWREEARELLRQLDEANRPGG